MFRMIENVLTAAELQTLRGIAARANFVDGRISAVGSPVKNNVQIGDASGHNQASQLMGDALYRSDDFRAFAFPRAMSPPWLTRYETGMHYGMHVDFGVHAERRSNAAQRSFLHDLHQRRERL